MQHFTLRWHLRAEKHKVLSTGAWKFLFRRCDHKTWWLCCRLRHVELSSLRPWSHIPWNHISYQNLLRCVVIYTPEMERGLTPLCRLSPTQPYHAQSFTVKESHQRLCHNGLYSTWVLLLFPEAISLIQMIGWFARWMVCLIVLKPVILLPTVEARCFLRCKAC